MPWHLEKRGDGYVVVTDDSGRAHSKHPLSKAKALAQLRALHANVKEKIGRSR